jgi:hypothetical protein
MKVFSAVLEFLHACRPTDRAILKGALPRFERALNVILSIKIALQLRNYVKLNIADTDRISF